MEKIIFDPEAKKEIKEAAEYYENCQERLGQKFLGAVERSVENISLNPLMYRKLSDNFGVVSLINFLTVLFTQ